MVIHKTLLCYYVLFICYEKCATIPSAVYLHSSVNTHFLVCCCEILSKPSLQLSLLTLMEHPNWLLSTHILRRVRKSWGNFWVELTGGVCCSLGLIRQVQIRRREVCLLSLEVLIEYQVICKGERPWCRRHHLYLRTGVLLKPFVNILPWRVAYPIILK